MCSIEEKIVPLFRENIENLTTNTHRIMNKNILIKQGYGDIRFDMPVEEVVAIMGEADEVENIDNAADETTTVLHYGDDLTLFFEGENPILSCIDIADLDATLFDQDIFDLTESEIIALMKANNCNDHDIDDEEWGERCITFVQGNIDFYLEDDELMSVTIGK